MPALSLAAALALAGCGGVTGNSVGSVGPTGPTAPSGPGPGQTGNYAGPAFTVTVKTGTIPLSGAEVQLYSAGVTGNGAGATSLLTLPVATGTNGVAAIAVGYTCPFSNSMVYVISKGGAIGAGAVNQNVWLMSAIGPCNGLSSGENLVVDEVTTVAAAYSLAPFYVTGGAVGASATNSVGLMNAFATAATLGDPLAGTSPGSTLPSNASSPAARVNSLANILNACVASAPACSAFYAVANIGGTPVDTLDAMVKVAQNPTANTAALYTLAAASTAYSPALIAQPTDWSMFLNFSGGGMNLPTGMGVDSQGNVWVASYENTATKFSPLGAPIFPNGITGYGLYNSYGLAVDLNDNAWIPNEQPFIATNNTGSVTELNSAGASLSGAGGYSAPGVDYPTSVALDPNGTVWVADNANGHVTLLNSSGTALSGASGYSSGMLLQFPITVIVDANHYGWVGNYGTNYVVKIAPDGSSLTPYTTGYGVTGLAVDQSDNVWTANYYSDSVSLLNNSGTALGTFTANGTLFNPQGIAVDGAGNVWVANYRATYLTELAGAGAATPGGPLLPATGIGNDTCVPQTGPNRCNTTGLLESYALSIDASGDIWVTNEGNNTITKFVGIASPVKTPLSGVPKAP